MQTPTFLTRLQFSIRTMLAITTLVAFSLFAWRERMRYLNERLFVSVIDHATGDLLAHFQYQTYVITNESVQDEDWSDWKVHQGPSVLTIGIPEHCRIQIRARAVDLAGGYSQKEVSTLVFPELSHTTILRMVEGKSFQSFLVDSTSQEPIRDARIIPSDFYDTKQMEDSSHYDLSGRYLDAEFATVSDPHGRFVVRNVREEFTIDSAKHKRRIMKFQDASEEELEDWRKNGIRLEPAVPIYGRVTCQETGEPIPNCEVIFENSQFKVATSGGFGEPRLIRERTEFDRVTQTDESGYFELCADSQTKDSKVWFSKKGWTDESVGLSDHNIDIRLAPSPFELAGFVIDETGEPVREFVVKILSNWRAAASSNGPFDFNDDNLIGSWKTKTGEEGDFRFDHISDGTYNLVTSYFGHVVNTRPLVIESRNLRVDPIDLPPLGKIRGLARYDDSTNAPFHRMYVTDHHGIPQKWFHTDHRGEFELQTVPCGWYGMGPKPERLSLLGCGGRWSVDVLQFVEPGKTMEVSFKDFAVFDLRGLSRFAGRAINIARRSSPPGIADLKTREIEQESDYTIQVMSRSEARDGDEFSLQMSKGKCKQELTLVYHANRRRHPNQILFRSCLLRLNSLDAAIPFEKFAAEPQFNEPNSDDPFAESFAEAEDSQPSALQAELYVGRTTIYLLKQNQVVSKVSMIGPREIVPFLIDEREPDAAVFHNTKFGFARIEKLQRFDRDSPAVDLRFEEGAEIRGKMKLNGLPLLPSCIRMVDECGVTFVTSVCDDCTFEFKNVWPGKWSVQMIGNDPFLGERVLAERQVTIEGVESQFVSLNAVNQTL